MTAAFTLPNAAKTSGHKRELCLGIRLGLCYSAMCWLHEVASLWFWSRREEGAEKRLRGRGCFTVAAATAPALLGQV